jgi:hypothetical protein
MKSELAAHLQAIVDMIPEGPEYDTLRYTITRMAQSFPDKLWDITPARMQGWIDEIASGDGRDASGIRSDIFRVIVGVDEIMRVYGVDEETAQGLIDGTTRFIDLEMAEPPDGAVVPDPGSADPNAPSGIMSGGEFITIEQPDGSIIYAVSYLYRGVQHIYTFESEEEAIAALGDIEPVRNVLMEDIYGSDEMWILGDATEFIGQDGTYSDYMYQVEQEAAAEAGAGDPGRWARLYDDPEVQHLVAMATEQDWSSERLMAEIRQTEAYEKLYPGANTLAANGSTDPEGDWLRYYNDVERGLEDLGYERDADGTYDSIIGEMIESGITVDEWNAFVPVFVRAESTPEYMEALAKWYAAETGSTIGFEDWFEVLEGTTTAEMDEIVEKATLQYRLDMSTLRLEDEQIARLADMTQLSEREMAMAFSTAEQALLSVGDTNLARYGLSEEALVNAQFMIDTEGTDTISTREGAMSATEIRQRARKAATELGIQDDQKRGFFLGFDRMSRPVRQGLQASRPEMG